MSLNLIAESYFGDSNRISLFILFQIMTLKLILFPVILFFFNLPLIAQSAVSITVNTKSEGNKIPEDFIGESFETASIRIDNRGVKGYFFDSTNAQLINLFKELGIKNLRIGGGTVDNVKVNPTKNDIDALFRFAAAAGVKVIYSFRLRSGDPDEDASIAKYIWDNHKDLLDCFAIGNEPDWHSFHIVDPEIFESKPGIPGSAYPSFLKKWRKIAAKILESVPDATFTGPDTGSNFPVPGSKDTYYNGKSWAVNFAEDEKNTGKISFVSLHNYVGQDAESQKLTPELMINQMLSPKWDDIYYPAFYKANCTPALPAGMGYRLTESNSFSGGVNGGSNSFAASLFALDYLHWWAEHNCLGVNYHSTQWRYNATFYMDDDGNYHINPMGYGIKAFDIGGHGRILSLGTDNPDSLNITAYAVKDSANLFLTVINKEHFSNARSAGLTINKVRLFNKASVIFLKARDAASTSGITLGGVQINNHGIWKGDWKNISPDENGGFSLNIPVSSAAIIKISHE